MVLIRRGMSDASIRATIAALLLSAIVPASAQDEKSEDHSPLYYVVRGEVDISRANDASTLITWDAEAWGGYDDQYRLWIKSQGDVRDLHKKRAEDQLLLSIAVSEFWNLQIGGRHDWEPSGLNFAVIGIEGLAPHFFETDAALFLSEEYDLSARIEQSIDILLTQQLIAKPHVEINASAVDVSELGIGAGLTSVEAGVQIRYEITRKFAPYIDFNYQRSLGETSIIAHAAGEEVEEATVRAGIRFWF